MGDPDVPHALYRFFDAEGALLYVGITNNPGRRWSQHERDRPWWSEVARIDLEQFPTRAAVLAAEREAIETERPRYNVIHAAKVATVADAPDWPGCCVCGAGPSTFAVDSGEAYAYESREREFMEEMARKHGGRPVISGADLFRVPVLAPWRTYCPQHEDQADYGFPVGDWRSTVGHIGHLLDQHPTMAAGSGIGEFLQELSNYGHQRSS